MSQKKSFEELKERARLALDNPRLKEIARFAYGSQSGHDLPIMEGFGEKEAISCEYLVKLREAYLDRFIELVGEPKLGKSGKRTFEELEIRSKLALENPKLREMAIKTDKGPNEAKDEVIKGGFTEEEAKSYRYLIQIKRYYPDKFDEVLEKTKEEKQTPRKVRKTKKLKKKTLKERPLKDCKRKDQEERSLERKVEGRKKEADEKRIRKKAILVSGEMGRKTFETNYNFFTVKTPELRINLLPRYYRQPEIEIFTRQKGRILKKEDMVFRSCPNQDSEGEYEIEIYKSGEWEEALENLYKRALVHKREGEAVGSERRKQALEGNFALGKIGNKESGMDKMTKEKATKRIQELIKEEQRLKKEFGIEDSPKSKGKKRSRQEKKLQRKLRSKKKLALQVEALKLFLKKEKLSDQRLIGIANRNIKRVEKEQLLEDKELPATIAFMAAGATENQGIIKELLDTINLNSELTSHLRLIKDRCLEILREKLSKEGRRKKWKKEAKRENLKTLQIILTPSLATAITGLISKQFLPFLPMAIVIFVGLGLIYLFVSDYYFYLLTGIVNYKQGYLPLN